MRPVNSAYDLTLLWHSLIADLVGQPWGVIAYPVVTTPSSCQLMRELLF